jgi:protein-S-isoprenylcysteine O-methyltransferase Ste14
MKRVDKLIWKHRNILAGLPLIVLLVSTRWEFEADMVIWPLAVILFLLGVALRAWAGCHCWYAQRRPRELTVSGPYAYVRHPMYIGNLLILMGASVASELVWLVPAALAWAVFVYGHVVRYEEEYLLAKYGESFLRYQRQVPRWFPRHWRPLTGSERGMSLAGTLREGIQNLYILLPFVLKELNPFGFWHHS